MKTENRKQRSIVEDNEKDSDIWRGANTLDVKMVQINNVSKCI